jgi:hypothetical protein
VSFSDRPLSGVRPSVHLFVCPSVNFYIFYFLSRTTGPILTRFGTNHSWVDEIQGCLNKGDSASPRGDNSKRVKIHWKYLKIFFSRTSRPNSIKFGTNYPCITGIQVCSSKGSGRLQWGDNRKNGVGDLKNLFLQNRWTNFNQTWYKSFLGRGDSSLFKRRG